MDQPILRRFAPVNADCFQRRTANRAACPPEIVLLRGAQITGEGGPFIGDFPGLPPELTPGVPSPLRRSAEVTFGNEFPGRLEPGEVLPFRGMPPADRE